MNSTLLPRRVGLARALSKLGYCSRSQGVALVRSGRVQLNGVVRKDPETPVRMETAQIAVDGRPLEAAAKVYLMLNKPRGFVTTVSDEKGRASVYDLLDKDLLDKDLPWVAPIGRLDKASEGLLLFTNDSEWAARIADPDTHLPKRYHVQVAALANPQLLEMLRRGVLADPDILAVKEVSLLRSGKRHSWLDMVLDEGKNRHIRRMLSGVDIEVLRLVRVAIGPLVLGQLPKGKLRPLSQPEKSALDKAMAGIAQRRV